MQSKTEGLFISDKLESKRNDALRSVMQSALLRIKDTNRVIESQGVVVRLLIMSCVLILHCFELRSCHLKEVIMLDHRRTAARKKGYTHAGRSGSLDLGRGTSYTQSIARNCRFSKSWR